MAVWWPDLGTRVTVRYRRPTGSVPPLTDAVGRLLSVDPTVRVRTKTGATVEIAPADVVAVRGLTDAPVRTAEIRAIEHAAAKAWPGVEQAWLGGWWLRAGHGTTMAANSAVPLDISAQASSIPDIVEWYRDRGLTPRLALADRLLRPTGLVAEYAERILVRDLGDTLARPVDRSISVSARPDDSWLRFDSRRIPLDVLTAVVEGDLAFGIHPGGAAARASVTDAPGGTRWVGLSAIPACDQSGTAALCEALLAWGAQRGATRAYLTLPDAGSTELPGFRPHHRRRYLRPPDSL